MRPVEAVHGQLVRPTDEFHPVRLQELLGDVLAEGVACATWRAAPAGPDVGVGPQHVCH